MKSYPIKLTLTIISSVSLITLLAGKVSAITELPLQIANYSTTSIAQAETTPDIDLLAKTIRDFLQSDRYLTESESLVSARTEGFDVKFNIKTKTIAQSGRKFRSEITFTEQGDKGKSTRLVISDGEQVWIYRPDLKQYAVTSYTDFRESFLIGISSLMFIEFPEDARQPIAQSENSKSTLQEAGLTNLKELQQEQRTVDGEELSIYTYKDSREGFTFSGFIQPQTANLKQLEMRGNSEGLDIVVTEKILARTTAPAIDAQTFTFTPPAGVKKVESLSISPF
ncbi:LolA family protein [Anabaena catenula]|uniref:Outer membrane lipoprotein carrier protein LolA n=1 Tax=Anabaena catenula FACHB-362 TaxID=2692877 RepID=A0ABR8J5T2_9NOST|nr:hypothetical protein [Anabaena catenula]MBD2693714.1 hypothetical protein [Anabaena catenula FACHB-362]